MERQEEVDALGASSTHFVMEVIDVGSAQLLASATYPVGEFVRGSALLPHGFFRNEMTGYVYNVDEAGLPTSKSSRACW